MEVLDRFLYTLIVSKMKNFTLLGLDRLVVVIATTKGARKVWEISLENWQFLLDSGSDRCSFNLKAYF